MSARASLIPRACLAALAAREHTARLVACAGGRAPVAERTRSRYTDRARLAAARRPRMHTRMHTRARACEKRLRSRAPRAMPTRSHDRSQRSSYDRRNVVAYRHRRNHTRQSMSIKSRTVRTVKLFRVGLAFCFVLVRPHTTVNAARGPRPARPADSRSRTCTARATASREARLYYPLGPPRADGGGAGSGDADDTGGSIGFHSSLSLPPTLRVGNARIQRTLEHAPRLLLRYIRNPAASGWYVVLHVC